MIRLHYRHLPMGCRYSLTRRSLDRYRYRTTAELKRAEAEGIRIPEDTLVWTTIHAINAAFTKEKNANQDRQRAAG